MTEVSQQAADFLKDVFDMTGLQLRVGVKQGIAGEVLDIEGNEAELLQAQTGELLERCSTYQPGFWKKSCRRHAAWFVM
jgi:predicted RNA-binding protein Jag